MLTLGENGWTAQGWAALRLLLGGYLFVHFVSLLGWSTEIFSSAGMQPSVHSPLFGVVPSLLWVSDAPLAVTMWVLLGAGSALALAVGWRDRVAAGLCLWVLAGLFAANPLINNPSLPHIGWLLLAHTMIPAGPSVFALIKDRHAGADWRLPPAIFAAGWAVMALAYGYSGVTKLVADSWLDGSAMSLVLQNPLARPSALRTMLLEQPTLLKIATWGALALELTAPLWAWNSRTRPFLWTALLAMQLGLLVTLDFADLTWGMLVLSAWTFDPRWLSGLRRDSVSRPPETGTRLAGEART